VVTLSQEGPVEEVIRASPRARAWGAGGVVQWMRDVIAADA
jgi:hypothetical protein